MPRLHQRLKVIRIQPSTRNLRCSSRMSHGNSRLWRRVRSRNITHRSRNLFMRSQSRRSRNLFISQSLCCSLSINRIRPLNRTPHSSSLLISRSLRRNLFISRNQSLNRALRSSSLWLNNRLWWNLSPWLKKLNRLVRRSITLKKSKRNVRVSVSNWPHGISRFQNLLRSLSVLNRLRHLCRRLHPYRPLSLLLLLHRWLPV